MYVFTQYKVYIKSQVFRQRDASLINRVDFLFLFYGNLLIASNLMFLSSVSLVSHLPASISLAF